jgi:cobalt-precorrin 5A hydrolase/precorrin-3B C17-methyltransferase
VDPAVITIDQKGQFVISLCGGHQGGADQLTRLIAHQLNATAIITGGANGLELPAIDILGLPFGWRKGEGDWTGVSATLARGEAVQVIQETGSPLWQTHLPENHPFSFTENPTANGAKIWISSKKRARASLEVQWHTRVLWVGIGCERGTSKNLIAQALEEACERYHLALEAIAGLATIDLKADELGIIELAREHNYPIQTFSAEQLKTVTVPNPSPMVNQEVGTPSVAEAAAILATNCPNPNLLVTKQILRTEGEKGAVTIAIAQSDLEYTDRSGKLYLVGIGPGSMTQITPAAQTAIVEADAVIGYSLYLDLIASLRRPGQFFEASPITQEKQRAQRAIFLAQWGLTVAVVSSGDCGIYGMAGLVLEELQRLGWDGNTPEVEVFPGITAMSAAAARLGAPLMHDFCTISLSDLLTPWQAIEKRLQAAAAADFVTAIYNPRSHNRTQQIVKAREIFLQQRSPDTPVALVQNIYREDEQIILTTLEKMHTAPIDMLTTVIIGNSSTRVHGQWMITPRGYFTSRV